jgi:dipeptidyl aminopeptidase/acylaminoacyl peptidase
MQPIEIRLNKWIWIPMITFLIASLTVMFYITFFSGKFDDKTLLKLLTVGLIAWLGYWLYFPVRQMIKNEPALTISKSEITINKKGKPVTYLQIQGWHIEKDKENSNRYLILETTEGKKSYSITWLEKKPEEIEELIITYGGKQNNFESNS